MARVLEEIVYRINNDKKLAPTPVFLDAVQNIISKVSVLHWAEAHGYCAPLIKQKNVFTKREIKYLKELNKRLKKVSKARASWGIADGQTPPPCGNPPSLSTFNGIGSGIYGNTLYFLVLFLPIVPVARYAVIYEGSGQYSFHGKLELNTFQKVWKWTALGAIGCGLFYILAKSFLAWR